MDNSLNASRYQSSSHNKDNHHHYPVVGGRAEVQGNTSALRLKKKQHDQRRPTEEDEEDEYERRREEELKRQIRSKEAEIQNLSKASDFLRSKIDKSVTQRQQQQVPNENKYASFGRQVPERDKSPYGFSKGGREEHNTDFVPPPHVREHIANLQSDNASLMRRLNLVLQELDRVSKEKEEIQSRLQQFAKESMNLQRLINGEDNLDKVNRYMNEDLLYERDRNQKLKHSLKEQEIYKNDMLNELRKVEDTQDGQAHQSQQITGDLQQKLNQISDIDKEIYYAQEKVKQLNNAIEQGKLDEMADNQEKSDLQRIINQLLYERNDLLSKLDNLTSRYDECVREISYDRAEMERHNRQHSKLVTAKIIFQELESILSNKKKFGFEEIKIYCSFDSKCHGKLQTFAKVLNTIGRNKLQISLQKWFQVCLKPMECKGQSGKVAHQIARTRLVGKMFYNWMRKYQRRIDQYDLKTKAIAHIWQIKTRDSDIEQKRAFSIWIAALQRVKQQKLRVKKLIWSLYFKKLNLSLNTWKNHSTNLDSQVRLNILAQQFTQKQYLNLMFCNFKYKSFENKRKRLNTLFHYVKYWKDYINYKKFLMGAQVQALHFTISVNTSLLKACFDAMKQSKEEDKFFKLSQALNESERPMINDLNNELGQRIESRQLQLAKRAGEQLCNMANKSMMAYFGKWKQIYTDFKECPNSKMKGRIIKSYNDKIRMAFNRWKILLNSQKVINSEIMVLEQQDLQQELTNNVMSLQKENKDKAEIQDQCGQRRLNKCVISYQKRLVSIAMGRWKDKQQEVNIKETGADVVIKRLRCRILRKAFDLYVAGTKYKKKLQIEEVRCAYYNKTRNERLLTEVFNQWKIYKNNFKKSKDYWFRIYLRLDKDMSERAFKTWKEVTKLRQERELQDVENGIISNISELNHEIGEINAVEESQQQQIKSLNGQLTKQAQRVLANRFANFYYTGQTRGFEKWKEQTIFCKRRDTLVKRSLDHWKKHYFYFVKSCFKNWMIQSDIQVRKEQVKKEELKIKDNEHALDIQTKMFSSLKNKLTDELTEIHRLQDIYNQRLQKSIQLIVNKVDKNDFMSQKRYILQQWRDYVKRQKFFIFQVKNVIQKSLWNHGFQAIREKSRCIKKEDNKEEVLNKFRVKFWKRNCQNAFSVWKSGNFKVVFTTVEDIIAETNQKIEDHQTKVLVRKEVNSEKACKVIGKQYLKNLFYGWRNVSDHYKQNSTKNELCDQNIKIYQKKLALIKWRKRKEATKIARIRSLRLKEKFKRIRKMLVFQAIRDQFLASKDFMARMSNLANIHDHQALKMGYNSIISFSRSKNYVHQKQKEIASKHIHGIFNNLIQRRKTEYLADLKFRCLGKNRQDNHKMYTILNNLGNKLRVYFTRWKGQTEHQLLELEMHNEGPIREQIFEERILLKNCEALMSDEGYSKEDIQEALKQGVDKQNGLMLKAVRRFQHYNQDLYTKPKMFDRWRQFVHMRKLMKYWLKFVNNRGQYVKCDLAVCFDRWKKYDTTQKESLKRLSKEELDKKMIHNSDKLGHLADNIQDKEETLRYLSDQREELVENYIKGQRLALVLWQNNFKRAKHRAFMRWSKNALEMKNEDSDDALRKNVELIAALKEKIRQLEKDNDDYSNENEELRQFSLDGYEIAKNVQALSHEREKLSVDLADKAQTIRKLLDENDKLNKKLKSAQDEAQNLIKSTSKYMGSGNSGNMAFQSPMMRNNAY